MKRVFAIPFLAMALGIPATGGCFPPILNTDNEVAGGGSGSGQGSGSGSGSGDSTGRGTLAGRWRSEPQAFPYSAVDYLFADSNSFLTTTWVFNEHGGLASLILKSDGLGQLNLSLDATWHDLTVSGPWKERYITYATIEGDGADGIRCLIYRAVHETRSNGAAEQWDVARTEVRFQWRDTTTLHLRPGTSVVNTYALYEDFQESQFPSRFYARSLWEGHQTQSRSSNMTWVLRRE